MTAAAVSPMSSLERLKWVQPAISWLTDRQGILAWGNWAPTASPTPTTVFQSIATFGWSWTISRALDKAVGPSRLLSYSVILMPTALASLTTLLPTSLIRPIELAALPYVKDRLDSGFRLPELAELPAAAGDADVVDDDDD